MKREDLEAREFGLIIASSNFPFYAAPEADAVMDAMEARIKKLEHQVMTDCTCDSSKSATLRMDLYKAQERIKELEATISKMETTTPKWISVKDRLPPKNKEFIGCTIKGSVSSCWIVFSEHAIDRLSHWMPLPPPPTTEESSATEKEM